MSVDRAVDLGSIPAFPVGFFTVPVYISDLHIGILVATLQGAWNYRVGVGTGWPCVCILCLGETESFSCNSYFSEAEHTNCLGRSDPEIY